MKQDDILDNRFAKPKIEFVEPAVWWGNLRVWYNVALILTIALVLINYAEKTVHYGVTDAIFQSTIVCAIANLFYTVGAGVEITLMHYFDGYRMKPITRLGLYLCGVLFSVLLAWQVYGETLHGVYYSPVSY